MKKVILLIALAIGISFVFSSNFVKADGNSASSDVSLVSSTVETSVVSFTLNGYNSKEVETPQGISYVLSVDEGTPILKKGAPDLSKLTASVIIPDRDEMKVSVESSSYKEYHGVYVAPSKGNFTRDIDPATVPYEYGVEYNTDAFYPGKLAELRDPYILRDYRGQTIVVYPFQYNPKTKVLRVYDEITVKVESTGKQGENPLTRSNSLSKVDRDFNTLYNRHFLNAQSTRYTPVEEEGNMLIISFADFMPAMTSFIEWKTLTGRPVEMVDVATIGNSSAIKTFVEDYYNNNGLTYLLLVGDAAQVPTSYASGDSDNDYSYVAGNDHYADFFVGRFSAENIDEVITQVNRTIEYEKEPDMSSDWFSRSMGIASNQGPGDDNEYDYEHIRNMQQDLLNFTYTYNAELFDGSQGGNDASGNPTPSMVAQEIEDGSGIILYTGHGSNTSWSSSGFSNSDVNNLTNTGMYPFIWSVACVNGNFKAITCFAEAWLRATDNSTGEPTGAIATLMSTINQSWDPPMGGQDEMVDILVESYDDNIKRTFGGISMNGCAQMIDEYGNGGEEMADTWTCFGDPSVMVRTAMPMTLSVDYMNPVPLGTAELEITTNSFDGVVCLTFNGNIVATAYITNGSATLTFPEITSLESMDLVITAFNFQPYIGTLDIVGEPGQVINPSPAQGQANIAPFTQLHWEAGLGGVPTEYTVYLGTDNPPTDIVNGETVYENYFIPPYELNYLETYYWRVDAHNEHGSSIGEVWEFTCAREPDENFESGDFNSWGWTSEGDLPWSITDGNVFNGIYSACSGPIEDGQVSSMILTLDIDAAFGAPISFYKMVSSDNGDKLQFLIDGDLKDEWKGLTAYTKETYMVSEGTHTFEWRYFKDDNGSAGDDCAWVDYIYFPPLFPANVIAGEDANICEGELYTVSGQATNFNSCEWTTSGTGTFDNANLLEALYTPSQADYDAGEVTLTLTIIAQGEELSDDMSLVFDQIPETPDTPEGPEYVDLVYTTTSEYTSHSMYAAQYTWNIEPDYAGSFDSDVNTCIINWDPSFLGEALISVKGINDCGESEFSQSLAVTVDNTVDIKTSETDASVSVIPNPSSGFFVLNINTEVSDIVDINITDALGNSVYRETGVRIDNSKRIPINIDSENKGLYFGTIEGKKLSLITKVILY